MSLRVIGGRARGHRLKRVPGDTTRPIMDRVKESLFNIIGQRVVGGRFLDLYAGTGSVGIEALSRGARQVVFVEMDRTAAKTIRENLTATRLDAGATIRRADVLTYLRNPPSEPFNYIYIAPPQYKNLWLDTLQALDNKPGWVPQRTTVIVQIDPVEQQPISLTHLVEIDQRRYGNTILWFFEGRRTED